MKTSKALLLACCAALTLSGCMTLGKQKPAPVTLYGNTAGESSAGVHTVTGKETIYTIAKGYRLPMQDIIALNDLAAPFALTEGQRLKLPPPQEYTTRPGDTLYSVSRTFAVGMNDLASLNNLQQPYTVAPGTRLRLPAIAPGMAVASAVQPDPYLAAASMSGGMTPEFGATSIETQPVPVSPGAVSAEVLAPPPGAVMGQPLQPPPAQMAGGYPASPYASQYSVAAYPPSPTPVPPPVAVQPVNLTPPAPPPRESSKFMWPVKGEVISGYGPKKDGRHNDGMNIRVPKGTPVKAAENGTVVYAGSELQGYGNMILIKHADKWVTAYAHLDNISVHKGTQVRRGDTIGVSGATGSVDSPQLHFEIRRGTSALNPQAYLDG